MPKLTIMLSLKSASAARKKKNKKKSCPAPSEATPRAPASDPSSPSSVDHSVLCCTHHEVMVAGLAMLGLNTSANKGKLCGCASLTQCLVAAVCLEYHQYAIKDPLIVPS